MPSGLPFRSVTSRQNPLVGRFRRAARRADTDELVLIEGVTLTQEATRAGWAITALAAAADRFDSDTDRQAIERIPVEGDRLSVSRAVLEAMSPASSPSGVVALARPPARKADPFAPTPALIVIASDVQDPGNVGAIARAAEAAGATGLLLCGVSADPFGWKALRGSMGSAFRLPIKRYPGASEALRSARSHDLRLLAMTARAETTVHDIDMRGATAIIVGGEGPGLPSEVLDAADARVGIPMKPPVESLNVAVAAGIVLYEAMRQRRLDG